MNLEDMYDVVWLAEDRTFAFLLHEKAYFAIVLIPTEDGWEEVIVLRDEYELWEERAIDFESD